MAECTEVNNIIVEGASSSSANGTYTKLPILINGYSAWTKDGDGTSYPIIRADDVGGDINWNIVGNVPFPGAPLYNVTGNSATNNTCPVGLTWSVAAFGTGSAPTVTAGTPPAPDPYAPWGGLQEYLRKRNILELF